MGFHVGKYISPMDCLGKESKVKNNVQRPTSAQLRMTSCSAMELVKAWSSGENPGNGGGLPLKIGIY